jgi:hypothetical protein
MANAMAQGQYLLIGTIFGPCLFLLDTTFKWTGLGLSWDIYCIYVDNEKM